MILFSSNLDLFYEKIINYYKLRFKIEFNFRDAKQFWCNNDFINLGKTSVNKAYYRGFRYAHEMLKMLPHKPDPILNAQIFAKFTSNDSIHKVYTAVEPS